MWDRTNQTEGRKWSQQVVLGLPRDAAWRVSAVPREQVFPAQGVSPWIPSPGLVQGERCRRSPVLGKLVLWQVRDRNPGLEFHDFSSNARLLNANLKVVFVGIFGDNLSGGGWGWVRKWTMAGLGIPHCPPRLLCREEVQLGSAWGMGPKRGEGIPCTSDPGVPTSVLEEGQVTGRSSSSKTRQASQLPKSEHPRPKKQPTSHPQSLS